MCRVTSCRFGVCAWKNPHLNDWQISKLQFSDFFFFFFSHRAHTFKPSPLTSHCSPFCPPHLLSITRPSQITQEVQRCLGHGYDDLVLSLHIEASPAADWSRGCCCDNSVSVCRRRMGTWRPKWCVFTDAETSPQRSSLSRISMHVSSCERLLYPQCFELTVHKNRFDFGKHLVRSDAWTSLLSK